MHIKTPKNHNFLSKFKLQKTPCTVGEQQKHSSNEICLWDVVCLKKNHGNNEWVSSEDKVWFVFPFVHTCKRVLLSKLFRI